MKFADESGRARQVSNRQDVLLGVGLVAAFSIVVLVTFRALHPDHSTVVATVSTMASTLVVAGGMVLLPWRRLPAQWLLMFPVLLVVSQVVLATTTVDVAVNYTSFLALAFVYIGLTQDRGASVAFALLAAPCWIFAQAQLTPALALARRRSLLFHFPTHQLIGETLRNVMLRPHTRQEIQQETQDVEGESKGDHPLKDGRDVRPMIKLTGHKYSAEPGLDEDERQLHPE